MLPASRSNVICYPYRTRVVRRAAGPMPRTQPQTPTWSRRVRQSGSSAPGCAPSRTTPRSSAASAPLRPQATPPAIPRSCWNPRASGSSAPGDCFYDPLQLSHPYWRTPWDHDAQRSVISRWQILRWAAEESLLVHAYHMPFPGLGLIKRHRDTYEWCPAPSRYGAES